MLTSAFQAVSSPFAGLPLQRSCTPEWSMQHPVRADAHTVKRFLWVGFEAVSDYNRDWERSSLGAQTSGFAVIAEQYREPGSKESENTL